MYFNSKKTTLLILGITSVICSRVMFVFFDDPEGPNLLIVMVMAVILYAFSFTAYLYYPSIKQNDPKKLLTAVFVQIISAVLFLFLFEL